MSGVLMDTYVEAYKSAGQRKKETLRRKKLAKKPMTPERRLRSKLMKKRWAQKRGAMMKGVKRGTKVRKMYQSLKALQGLNLTEDGMDYRFLARLLDGINDISSKFLKADCLDPTQDFTCEEKFLFYHEEIAPLYNIYNKVVESTLLTVEEGGAELRGLDDIKTALDALWDGVVDEGDTGTKKESTEDEEGEEDEAFLDENCEGCE
jgi:hypothetical protein